MVSELDAMYGENHCCMNYLQIQFQFHSDRSLNINLQVVSANRAWMSCWRTGSSLDLEPVVVATARPVAICE